MPVGSGSETAPARLGVFLVKPDRQSALLTQAQTAISRYALSKLPWAATAMVLLG